ncbi:LuxR C-terminal-related transcriptional regulator [Atopomonas sediminilitoris]|uniref:LuxR C-terminal-related transcriptional regulator n=1 Tax=Atopomonas sediminilitoris TaxID=2919919 RepID=UPI001F4E0EE6|nr:LuxR C-terminal-related transcriptional regulator [Atopomonas sediminilitoris]MCJ8168786.1 LuxR C-terminal-related transcriptional regulator [Atopomonas sediminilitoris]
MKSPLPSGAMLAGVCRTHLLARLQQAADKPLLIVLAPPGAGKSTLLEQWMRQAWCKPRVLITVQAHDNQPVWFFRRLLIAIRRQMSDFDASWFDPIGAQLQGSPVAAAAALAQALERLPQGLCLVFDDFQHIDDPQILAVLRALLQLSPQALQVCIASRQAPDLPLASLQLNDRVCCLEAHDLALTAAETQALSTCLGGEALPPEQLTAVHDMTEGWVAGVKMALLSYARFGLPALARFSGTQPQIVDYFGEVVLRQLPAGMRDFFLGSALLEVFDGPLCDAVLQREHSTRLLEDLAAQQLFMQPVEGRPGWYRYHPLLQAFLSTRLQVEQPQRVPLLHRRAAHYFAQQSNAPYRDDERALVHAQQLSEPRLQQQLLVTVGEQWLKAGYFSRLLKWLLALDEACLLEQPVLLGYAVEALTLSRCFHQADYYLQLAEQHGLAQGARGAYWLLLRLLHSTFQDDAASTLPQLAQGLRAPQVPMVLRAQAQTLLAYHDLMAADLASAIRHASQAQSVLAHSGHRFLQSYADLIVVLSRRHAGQSLQARNQVYADFAATPRDCPAWLNRATAMLVTLYEQNQLIEAQQLGDDLLGEVSASSASEAIVTVYVTLSRVLHSRGLAERGERLLDNLTRVLELGHYPRLFAHVAQEALRQALLSGSRSVLEGVARRFQLPQRLAAGEWEKTRPYSEGWERSGMAAVYWLLGSGQTAQAVRLLRVLAQALKASQMRVRALVVQINLLCLNTENASLVEQGQTLQRLIAEHGIACFSRCVLDEAPSASTLLQQLVSAGALPVPQKYREHYAALIGESGSGAINSPLPLCAGLTEKEREIVRATLAGLSNAQVSEQAGIAVSTTKWHLKNIYAKLGVSTRAELIVNLQSRA